MLGYKKLQYILRKLVLHLLIIMLRTYGPTDRDTDRQTDEIHRYYIYVGRAQ